MSEDDLCDSQLDARMPTPDECRQEWEERMKAWFGQVSTATISVPHFFTLHTYQVLQCVMKCADTSLGVWCESLHVPIANQYGFQFPSPETFHFWSEEENALHVKRVCEGFKYVNGVTVYLDSRTHEDTLRRLEDAANVQGGQLDDAEFVRQLFIANIGSLGWAGLQLDMDRNDYILLLFDDEKVGLRDAVKRCVELAGMPTFTSDDLLRVQTWPPCGNDKGA